jgi:hypothetical protein
MPCIYRFRWHDDYPPVVVISGAELDLNNREGVIWEGYNRRRCRRLLLYRTPGIDTDQFQKRAIEGTNKCFYVIEHAKVRWTRLGNFETSVFIVPSDGSRLYRTNYIWLGRGPFKIISRLGPKDDKDIKINDKTYIDRKTYQMCLSHTSIWVHHGEFFYSMKDHAVQFVGHQDEIAVRAQDGDEECKKLLAKIESKSFAPAR